MAREGADGLQWHVVGKFLMTLSFKHYVNQWFSAFEGPLAIVLFLKTGFTLKHNLLYNNNLIYFPNGRPKNVLSIDWDHLDLIQAKFNWASHYEMSEWVDRIKLSARCEIIHVFPTVFLHFMDGMTFPSKVQGRVDVLSLVQTHPVATRTS